MLRNSLAKTTDSWTVLNIFQLAAMNGMRIWEPLNVLRATCYARPSTFLSTLHVT